MVRLKKTFDNCTEAEADWCGKIRYIHKTAERML